ncbi:hypothetical protein HYALB_00002459 [Hymenoscyphus albidus]|uniref:Uncharacterized protein n=1 Tax=Hymenoscyphus albidus TaxID=595503 RepID=A0A9N9Q4F2_9HELO|nr:hypothetical protein HYALB_00002459 [Hymenoscyphus albidus]
MDNQQPSGTWRYNSVLGEMEDAIIRLEDDEQAPDPCLKSTIRAEHLTPLAFYRFYYLQLNQVQTTHPFASIHMTKYLTERRLWENYCKLSFHILILGGRNATMTSKFLRNNEVASQQNLSFGKLGS